MVSVTDILIEGVSPEEIPETLLVDLMDFIGNRGYSIEGISVIRTDRLGDVE